MSLSFSLSLPSSINELTWTIASRFLYLSQWRPSNRIVHIHRHSFEREEKNKKLDGVGWSMQQSKNGEWSLMSCLVDVWPYELSFDSIDLSTCECLCRRWVNDCWCEKIKIIRFIRFEIFQKSRFFCFFFRFLFNLWCLEWRLNKHQIWKFNNTFFTILLISIPILMIT